MKQPERNLLLRAVLAAAPLLEGRWPFLHLPVNDDDLVRGIYFERSSDPEGVYVWAFVQPLYVISETIVLSYGDRVGGGTKMWYSHEGPTLAAKLETAFPFIEQISTARRFAHAQFRPLPDDPNWLEAKGCSLILAGEIADGIQALREIPRNLRLDVPWMRELAERTQALASAAEQDPRRAIEMLATWKESTKRALKL